MIDFIKQPIKDFLNISVSRYKAVNATTPTQGMAEDSHIQIVNIIIFVLGCLSLHYKAPASFFSIDKFS